MKLPGLLLALTMLLAACGDDSARPDPAAPARDDAAGTAAAVDAGIPDTGASDATLAPPDTGILCGAAPCAADEVCVRPCCTGAGCTAPPPHCLPAPPACGQANACQCFDEDPCRDFGATCPGVSDAQVACACQ